MVSILELLLDYSVQLQYIPPMNRLCFIVLPECVVALRLSTMNKFFYGRLVEEEPRKSIFTFVYEWFEFRTIVMATKIERYFARQASPVATRVVESHQRSQDGSKVHCFFESVTRARPPPEVVKVVMKATQVGVQFC